MTDASETKSTNRLAEGFTPQGYRKAKRSAPYVPPVPPEMIVLPDGGDVGPASKARGDLEIALVPVPVWNAEDKVEFKLMTVARRKRPKVLKLLSVGGKEALDRYVGDFEEVGAARAVEYDIRVDGGSVGDGGVAYRSDVAASLSRA